MARVLIAKRAYLSAGSLSLASSIQTERSSRRRFQHSDELERREIVSFSSMCEARKNLVHAH